MSREQRQGEADRQQQDRERLALDGTDRPTECRTVEGAPQSRQDDPAEDPAPHQAWVRETWECTRPWAHGTYVNHLDRDEGIRDGVTPETLGGLKPSFRPDGVVTAGNASQLSDGAAALLLTDEDGLEELGVEPLARVVATGVDAVEPQLFGIGPVEAVAIAFFNSFLNELAYKPKGRESVLFYLPWLNHNFNSSFNLEDAGGPLLRSLIFLSCNGAILGYGLTEDKPYLRTLLESAQVPREEEIPVPSRPDGKCEREF